MASREVRTKAKHYLPLNYNEISSIFRCFKEKTKMASRVFLDLLENSNLKSREYCLRELLNLFYSVKYDACYLLR
jgi:hypothetical protein